MHRMGVASNDVDEVVDVLTSSAAIDLEGSTRISACRWFER